MKSSIGLIATAFLTRAAEAANQACKASTFTDMLPSNATIEKIASVGARGEYGEGAADIAYPTNPTDLPALCAVTVNVASSETSSFRFGLFLPTDWNGRFLAVGNGGFSGGINWLDMGAGVQYGFASMSTDTGHNSTAIDLSWALNKPEKQKDFGYRAMHGSVDLAKKMTSQFYGKSIKYSYYSGCSTGGRQGLKEAELYPDSFDGLLVGAPAWWSSHLATWTTKLATYNLPITASNHISATLFNIVGAEAIKQCDAVDGVEDGIISSPELCSFDPRTLLCGQDGVNASACLTEEQVGTLHNIYGDYYADGKFAFPGLEIGSESQWSVLLGGPAPNPLGDGYMQYLLFGDPSWNWTQYNDSIVWLADAQDPGELTADNYDFSPFRKRGGRIILYHGMSDGLIATGSSTYFYEQVKAATRRVSSFFKFFLVPGMQHCSGTAVNAPWYFAGPNQAGVLGTGVHSVPGFEDAKHDALLALMDWVEKGTEVEEIIATTWTSRTNASSGVLRQRPLCSYPETAVYDGTGDVDNADSWNCL